MTKTETVELFACGGLIVGLEHGLAADEVRERARMALRGGEVCNRALAFYLHEVESRRLYQQDGYASALDYAAKGLGIGRKRASELLATGRRLAELPRLDAAFGDGTLSWRKVRLVARVATAATEAAWVARAREVTAEELGAMVKAAQEGDDPPDLSKGLPQARFEVQLSLNRVQHELLEQAHAKLEQELGQRIGQAELVEEALRLLLASDADGSVPGRKPVDGSVFRVVVSEDEAADDASVAAASSDGAASARLRRRVIARDGARCQACESRRGLMVHHVVWRSRGGPTVADNLVTLCARCHGLVHEGLLQVAGAPGRWRMADRQGRPLERPFHGGGTPRVTLRWSRPAAASSAEDGATREALALADIPDFVDARWFREHQHLFDLRWKAGKLTLHRTREARRAGHGVDGRAGARSVAS